MSIEIGKPAPDFTLKDQNQNQVSLSNFRGKTVLLAFYPLDFSPVCTKEHTCFHDDFSQFQGLNAEIIGISVDSSWAHKAYAEKLNIPYRLLADFHPKGEVAKKFGLYMEEKGITNRASVIIDKEGIVRYVEVYDIPQQRNNQELIEVLKKIS